MVYSFNNFKHDCDVSLGEDLYLRADFFPVRSTEKIKWEEKSKTSILKILFLFFIVCGLKPDIDKLYLKKKIFSVLSLKIFIFFLINYIL